MRYGWAESPVGRLRIGVDARGLREIRFLDAESEVPGSHPYDREDDDVAIDVARAQLCEYFEGSRRAFALPLAPRGSEFQRRVWEATRQVPYGRTIAYGELAATLGDAGAARAVGTALHENPLPIVIPCHRVIGADGTMVGFGGGLERKRTLLRLEGALQQDVLF